MGLRRDREYGHAAEACFVSGFGQLAVDVFARQGSVQMPERLGAEFVRGVAEYLFQRVAAAGRQTGRREQGEYDARLVLIALGPKARIYSILPL